MKSWLKNFRIFIFNWLAAGKLTLTTNGQLMPQTYTIGLGGAGAAGSLGGAGGAHGLYYTNNTNTDWMKMNIASSSINFNVAKATGGWVVQVNKSNNNTITLNGSTSDPELHIIGEDDDFDSALGKIVTMACLKQ